jgi:hypothetical protein
MARAATPTQRIQLEEMAAAWEQLAEARMRQMGRQWRLATTQAIVSSRGARASFTSGDTP